MDNYPIRVPTPDIEVVAESRTETTFSDKEVRRQDDPPIRVPTPDIEVVTEARTETTFSDKEVQQQNGHPINAPTPNLEVMVEVPRMEVNDLVIELIPKPAPDDLDPLNFLDVEKTVTLGIVMVMWVSTSPRAVHQPADTH